MLKSNYLMGILNTITKKNTLICLLFCLIGGFVFGQTTTYTESFATTTGLSTSYPNTSFSTNLGAWTSVDGGSGLTNTSGNGASKSLKFKTGQISSATTTVLRGVSSITYWANTVGASSSITLTDGNSSFYDTKTIANGSGGTYGPISIPGTSNGVFTFHIPIQLL